MGVVDPHNGAAEKIKVDGHGHGRLRYHVNGGLGEIKNSPLRFGMSTEIDEQEREEFSEEGTTGV